MSEKQFKMVEDSNGLYSIFDIEDKEDEPLIYGAEFGTEKIVDLLNEQQAIIEAKDSLLSILSKENEQLRQKLDFYLLDEFEWKEKYED